MFIPCVARGAREPLTRVVATRPWRKPGARIDAHSPSHRPHTRKGPARASFHPRPHTSKSTDCLDGHNDTDGLANSAAWTHTSCFSADCHHEASPVCGWYPPQPQGTRPAHKRSPHALHCQGTHVACALDLCNTRRSVLLGANRRGPPACLVTNRDASVVTPHCRACPLHGASMFVTPQLQHPEYAIHSSVPKRLPYN